MGILVLRRRFACWESGAYVELLDDLRTDIARSRPPDPNCPSRDLTSRALDLIASGELSRASSTLLSHGVSATHDPHIHTQLQSKHPRRTTDLPPDAFQPRPSRLGLNILPCRPL